MKQKSDLDRYFKKFNLSYVMRKIKKIILKDPHLSSFQAGFRLSTNDLKDKCVFEMIEKKDSGIKIDLDHILSVGKFLLSDKGYSNLILAHRLAVDTKARIGYSIRDGKQIIFKFFLIFDRGLKDHIKHFECVIRNFGFKFNALHLRKNKSIFSVEFCGDIETMSYYKTLSRTSSLPHLCKKAYYFIAQKFEKSRIVASKKIYKIYDDENESLINNEVCLFLNNDRLNQMIRQDFIGFKIDGVGLRLNDNSKFVYIKKA